MDLISALESLVDELKEGLGQASLLDELEKLRVDFLGRKGRLAAIMASLPKLAPEDRPKAGQAANRVKAQLAGLLDARVQAVKDAEARVALGRFDATVPGRQPWSGSLHPITLAMQEICEVFQGLGFDIASGPEVESDYYNFEALNLPPDHPARDMQDTLYISDKVVLRTQTSAVQVHAMEGKKPPIAVIAPGKVYRRDSDITHTPMFHQVRRASG